MFRQIPSTIITKSKVTEVSIKSRRYTAVDAFSTRFEGDAKPLISSVKLNGEERCVEFGTGPNIDQYQNLVQMFSTNNGKCIVKHNEEVTAA